MFGKDLSLTKGCIGGVRQPFANPVLADQGQVGGLSDSARLEEYDCCDTSGP